MPKNIYELIVNPPNIDRSKENESALVYLVDHGWADDEIKYLFENYNLGEKYRSSSNPDLYLQISIDNAKKICKQCK